MDSRHVRFEDLEDGEFPAAVVALEDDDLGRLVSSYSRVVVDLWAPWCGPCRAMAPVMNEMAGELQGKVVFAALNTESGRATMSKYMVQSIPTLLIFKDGVFKDMVSGAMDKRTIMRKVMSV